MNDSFIIAVARRVICSSDVPFVRPELDQCPVRNEVRFRAWGASWRCPDHVPMWPPVLLEVQYGYPNIDSELFHEARDELALADILIGGEGIAETMMCCCAVWIEGQDQHSGLAEQPHALGAEKSRPICAAEPRSTCRTDVSSASMRSKLEMCHIVARFG